MKAKILKYVGAAVVALGAVLGVLKLVMDALTDADVPMPDPDSTGAVVDTLVAVGRAVGLA